MSGALSSVMGGAGGAGGMLGGLLGGGGAGGAGGLLGTIGGLVGTVIGGPIGGMIGQALGNMIGDAVGEATNQATDTLQKESGMPKFLADEIKNIVKEAVAGCKNNDVDPQVQHAVDNDKDMQSWKKSFVDELSKSMVDNCRKHMETTEGSSGGGGEVKGKKSWLQAMAAAMGATLGQKAGKMVELSNTMTKLTAEKAELGKNKKGGDEAAASEEQLNAQKFTQAQTELQGVSQEFSLLNSAFSNAIKSIGEGLSQMGRKG